MLRFFGFSRMRTIGITAVKYVDFKKIDSSIKQDGGWMESYPMQTVVSVPKERAEEIMAKLKLHDGITTVAGELTPRGIQVQAEMMDRFNSARPPRK